MHPPLMTGPIPPYSNVPIQPQNFKPSRFVITAITLGQTTTITTSDNTNYVTGQLVRLVIPESFGSYQLNEQTGYVLSIPATNQVVLNINSTNANPFVSSTNRFSQAQIMAVGDINNGPINIQGRQGNISVPGSFQNISPF